MFSKLISAASPSLGYFLLRYISDWSDADHEHIHSLDTGTTSITSMFRSCFFLLWCWCCLVMKLHFNWVLYYLKWLYCIDQGFVCHQIYVTEGLKVHSWWWYAALAAANTTTFGFHLTGLFSQTFPFSTSMAGSRICPTFVECWWVLQAIPVTQPTVSQHRRNVMMM